MADVALPGVGIWMFGRRYAFIRYNSSSVLDNLQYMHDAAGNVVRHQKNQIVLHYTAGNSAGQNTITYWNSIAPLPASGWICPQYQGAPPHPFHSPFRRRCPQNGPGHNWQADSGNCPVHHLHQVVVCPNGHGALVKSHSRASAHYVVELGRHRLNGAAQAYSDVVEVVEGDCVTWHGGPVNEHSIGIEHANVGWNWAAAAHDAAAPAMNGAGAARRPVDRNRWLHLANPAAHGGTTSNLSHQDFQAYEEEQYLAMILLLRHLCITHRIPRRFLGESTREKMSRWWHGLGASEGVTRSRLMRFRGILSHMNCHDDKECGGPAMHRNRLFRGILDEWWFPLETGGLQRPYYMGPFDVQDNAASYFRFDAGGTLRAELFHDADLDALQETRSYFDLDSVPLYYALGEATGTSRFPIGASRAWHGGIHLAPHAGNTKVYAAASGTLVAARLGGDADTENDPEYGSQRFVLIRHCVHAAQEADPDGGMRTDFAANPVYFFSLYMHLAPVEDAAAANDRNPPWFNYWLRRNAANAAAAERVFCPDVEVNVGDWLGACGRYGGADSLHFETMSREELTMAPWNQPNLRIHDPGAAAICDLAVVNSFITDRDGSGRIDSQDILLGAEALRNAKSYHKSEWALANADALTPLVPDAALRARIWDRCRHFMWVADAVSACPDLSTQLCDANGLFWHYHPVTFMAWVNRRILEENGEVDEPDFAGTNVTLECGYITGFASFATGTAVPTPAGATALRPFGISSAAYGYHYTQNDLACKGPGAHVPAATPPTATRFHIALLDFLETTRMLFGSGIEVKLSHLCDGHNAAAHAALCPLQSTAALEAHHAGLAADIAPTGATSARCHSLWSSLQNALGTFNASCAGYGGEPSRADLQEGFSGIAVSIDPMVQIKLRDGATLTAAEVAACAFHLQLTDPSRPVFWDAVDRDSETAAAA